VPTHYAVMTANGTPLLITITATTTSTHTRTHTHTHNTFTALVEFVRDYPGEQVPER